MSDKAQQEPSMEEILASIRRIISEDGETPPKPVEAPPPPPAPPSPPPPPPPPPPPRAAPPPPPPPPPPDPFEDDVLELTDVVDPPEEDAQDQWDLDEDLDPLADVRAAMNEEMRAPPPPPPPPPPPRRPAWQEDGSLVSPQPRDMATQAFSMLADNLGDEISLGSMRISPGSRTVEDVIRDLLRPLLREWLDANLPELVERLVKQEIDRMVRRSRERY